MKNSSKASGNGPALPLPSPNHAHTLHQSVTAAISALSSLIRAQQKQFDALRQLLPSQLAARDAGTDRFFCCHESLLNSAASLHLLLNQQFSFMQTILEHNSDLSDAFPLSPPDWNGLQAPLSEMEAAMLSLAESMLATLANMLRIFNNEPYSHLPKLSDLTAASLQSCEGLLYFTAELPLVTGKLHSSSEYFSWADSNRASLQNASAAIIQIEPLAVSLWLQNLSPSLQLHHRKLLRRVKRLISVAAAYKASELNSSAAPFAQKPWLNGSALNKQTIFDPQKL